MLHFIEPKTQRLFKRFTIAVAFVLTVAGCNEERQQDVTLTVHQTFAAIGEDGKPVQLEAGRGSYGWELTLIRGENEASLVLRETYGAKRSIPFRVPKDFQFGGAALAANTTGQNVSITQIPGEFYQVQDEPITRTESCTISFTETVCERGPDRQRRCFERTVTRTGSQQVTTQRKGFTQKHQMVFADAAGLRLATASYTYDGTYTSRDAGECY